jgi:hypothetical protein
MVLLSLVPVAEPMHTHIDSLFNAHESYKKRSPSGIIIAELNSCKHETAVDLAEDLLLSLL